MKADRWLTANPDAVKKNDFSGVDAMNWDPSVQALTRFPSVIEMLADHLEWTESLGEAFALQADYVAAAVQLLRLRAESFGNLKTTPEQNIVARDEGGTRVIYIAPADPERIYVPIYDLSVVFTSALPVALAFTTGVFVGSAWNNQWGWNNRRWNDVWIDNRTVVNINRTTRPGSSDAWRPDRPGQRPQRPDINRPRSDRPAARSDRPGARSDRPAARPSRPAERPSAQRPQSRPEKSRPQARQQQRPQPPGPQARPQQRPQANPPQSRPQQARPQGQARPQPQARPQGQARPQQRPQAKAQPNVRSQPQRGQRQGGGNRRNPNGN